MLSDQDLAAWAKRVGLSDEALCVVAQVRCSNPARRVGGGHSNVTGRYPSRKMGFTIQFESHRVELIVKRWVIESTPVMLVLRLDDDSDEPIVGLRVRGRVGPVDERLPLLHS